MQKIVMIFCRGHPAAFLGGSYFLYVVLSALTLPQGIFYAMDVVCKKYGYPLSVDIAKLERKQNWQESVACHKIFRAKAGRISFWRTGGRARPLVERKLTCCVGEMFSQPCCPYFDICLTRSRQSWVLFPDSDSRF